MVVFTFVLSGKDKSHWSIFLVRLLKHGQIISRQVSLQPVVQTVASLGERGQETV